MDEVRTQSCVLYWLMIGTASRHKKFCTNQPLGIKGAIIIIRRLIRRAVSEYVTESEARCGLCKLMQVVLEDAG